MIHQFLQRLEANRVLMKNKIILSIVTIIVVAIFAFIYWLKPEDNLNANIQNNSNNSSVKQINQNINSPNSSSIQPVNQLSVAPISTANGQKEFQMPNTNWQDRELLINGKKIKYTFGTGNPPEVALNPGEYTGDGKWKNYVTPATEKYLKEFLSDKSLKNFIDRCDKKLGLAEDKSIPGFSIVNGNDWDINKLLLIDPKTGRKELDEEKTDAISQLLYTVSNKLSGNSAISSCMNDMEIQNFENLRKTFDKATESYINQPKDGFYDQSNPNNPGMEDIKRIRQQLGIKDNN